MHHFKAPHDMFVYAPRYEDYLAEADIPEPSNLYDQPGPNWGSIGTRGQDDSLVGVIGSTISPQQTKRNLARHYRGKIKKLTGRDDLSDKELTHHAYQMYVKEYLRCVKGIDDNLKRIVDHLRASDLLENTVIFYTSDQGMLLGEHDFIDKRWMYEESIRMPLIVHCPKRVEANARCDWLINNVDFAPTILELAGAGRPNYMQGFSFASAFYGRDEPAKWRTATYYRYWMHMVHGHNNPGHFGIRTKTHKLIFFYGCDYTDTHNGRVVEGRKGNRYFKSTPASWELYDLTKDPFEMDNRYNDPDYEVVVTTLKRQLKSLRKDLGDTDDQYPHIRKIVEQHWGASSRSDGTR